MKNNAKQFLTAKWIRKRITSHRRLFLLAAACFTVFLLILLEGIFSENPSEKVVQVSEKNGIYDVTSFIRGEALLLSAGETYYPNQYVMPGEENAVIAERTENYGKKKEQYLSQHFIIQCPKDVSVYRLTVKMSGRHALRIYVNGSLAEQSGILGTTKKDTQVWENNLVCYVSPENGKLDVMVQAAQFYHNKRGASLAKIMLESGDDVAKSVITEREKGLLVMGALLSAASFLFCIYLLYPIAKATLYFVIACVVMAVRECLQSQAWTYFSWIPGNISFMLEYLSLVLLTIFLTLYLGQYGRGRFLKTIKYTAIASAIVYGVCVLFGDSVFYTGVLYLYQVVLVTCIVLGVGGIFLTLRNPSGEQMAALYGIVVFYIAAVRDILMYSGVLGKMLNEPIVEMSMLIFVLAQTVSLFLLNNRMMTEAREAEHRQFVEREGLEKLNRLKTEFLGDISHELKTPLMVVSGYAQNIGRLAEEKGKGDEEIVHKTKLITAETERLSLMVRQLLDITRIEEGKMIMDKSWCYMDEIIYEAVNTHYPILNKNKNRLDIKIDDLIPMVYVDTGKMAQVFINLIANASKHTKKGRITVSAFPKEKNLVIKVADTGEGISPERLEHVFERYSNTNIEKGSGEGTGLGLPICKYIVEEHGGMIWIESEEGAGTTVWISLPVK